MSADPRTVVVTGCSSGIGLSAAVAFARAGDRVVASMRDTSRSGALMDACRAADVDVEIATLDVADDRSVERELSRVYEVHGQIDVLVNNAGVGVAGTLEELDVAQVREAMETNFFGVVRMTKGVLPSMRDAGRGRVIAVSSISGVMGQPFNDAYCASKFAVEGLFEALQPVMAGFGVHLSVVEPGPVDNRFRDKSLGGDDPPGVGPYGDLRDRFAATADAAYEHAQSSEDIADLLVAIAADPEPRPRYQTSAAIERAVGRKLVDPTGAAASAAVQRWLAEPS